jgi:hypothetical protein
LEFGIRICLGFGALDLDIMTSSASCDRGEDAQDIAIL